MESILTSIKKLLGIEAEYTHFDADVMMHINTVFSDLVQLGVGPSEGFSIIDEYSTWNDFIPTENNFLNQVKTYVYQRVKLLFDPPQSSAHIQALEKSIEKFEWRLNVAAESEIFKYEESDQNGV